jgi:excisionase family DNA binding protein
MPQYITVKDIMKMYKCSKSTVYNWIDEGLPVRKFGRMTRFIESEVDKWLKENKSL